MREIPFKFTKPDGVVNTESFIDRKFATELTVIQSISHLNVSMIKTVQYYYCNSELYNVLTEYIHVLTSHFHLMNSL